MSNNTIRLIVLSEASFGAELEKQAQELQPGLVAFKDLASFAQSKQVLMEKSFDEEHIFISQESDLNQATLNSLVKVLKPGGSLFLTTKATELDTATQKRFNFAGLSGLEAIGNGVFKVTRKIWKQEQKQEATQPIPHPKNAFAAALAQNGAAEKVDPEALLTNDVITEADIGGSCDTKPKACKDCSCGRKEMEEQGLDAQRVNDLETGNIKSSCGNCYLGDAFRCASCPYKGLPSFEAGDKVKLDLNKLDLGEQSEVAFKVTEGGKVKINF